MCLEQFAEMEKRQKFEFLMAKGCVRDTAQRKSRQAVPFALNDSAMGKQAFWKQKIALGVVQSSAFETFLSLTSSLTPGDYCKMNSTQWAV